MAALLPAEVYGLEVLPGDVMIPAAPEFPATFRITMAAIDPSAQPEFVGTAVVGGPVRSTLKLLRQPIDPDDDDDSDDSNQDDQLEAMLNGVGSDDDEDDDEDKIGGPSDPSKSNKARREEALQRLKDALKEGSEDEDMEDAQGDPMDEAISKIMKGKAKATESDDEDDEDGDDDDLEIEEFVICTLDPEKLYQQPLDITVCEDEKVYFKVSGTHAVYLTGNYVLPADPSIGSMGANNYNLADADYDLSPDEDELDYDEEESDELDDLADPRISEVLSEEEEPPTLIKVNGEAKKGKNKREAVDSDEEGVGLDEIMAKSIKAEAAAPKDEPKLSKKQLKKQKNNAGKAVNADQNSTKTETESANGKKVQFAKNLEQGPSGSKVEPTKNTPSDSKASQGKPTTGVKFVQGVKIDDKKIGAGPSAKKGDKVGMRYIGKLKDGKVFDANKKGKPFSFKLGSGEVIKGWDIGIGGMAVGGERRITIPASLGYGSKGMAGIPANSELTFDVKLIELN